MFSLQKNRQGQLNQRNQWNGWDRLSKNKSRNLLHNLRRTAGLSTFSFLSFLFPKLLKLAKQHIAKTCTQNFNELIAYLQRQWNKEVAKPSSTCKEQTFLLLPLGPSCIALLQNLSSLLCSITPALMFPQPQVAFLGNLLSSSLPVDPFPTKFCNSIYTNICTAFI